MQPAIEKHSAPDKTRSMTYKLFVTDLDGTLLNAQHTLSARVQHAFLQAKQQGKFVTFATGRNFTSSLPIMQTLPPNVPVILYNGARVETLLPRQTLYAKNLRNEQALKAFALQQQFHMEMLLYLDDDIFVSDVTPAIQEFMNIALAPCTPVGDLPRFLGDRDPIKLLAIGQPEELARYARAYRALDSDAVLVCSQSHYLEILPSGVSKGNALKYLADYLDVPLQEIIAVGDNLNDVEMLSEAGLGVAMGNAHPDLKKVADHVTDSNDNDGVATLIERYLLS